MTGAGWRLVWGLVFCLMLLPATFAAPPRIVVVGGESVHHRAVFVAMRQALERGRSGHELVYRTLEQYQAEPVPSPVMLVSVGTVAAQALAAAPRAVPLLCVLLPRGEFSALPQTGTAPLGALFIDQPVRRYLLLARLTLPERRQFGAVLGPLSSALEGELLAEGRSLQLEVKTATLGDGVGLTGALEQVSRPHGILLALPDPVVVNADTAGTLILDAYHRGIALIGYSHALAKAGAVMAVHSAPEQLGQEAGEMILAALASRPVALPPPRYPSYFSVSVNYQVARALELNLPAEERLVRELRQLEGAP